MYSVLYPQDILIISPNEISLKVKKKKKNLNQQE